MEKKWTLGVLGLGEGRSIISAAINSNDWELKKICDLNEELCLQRIEEFGPIEYTLSYEKMLEDQDIEVIGIYTPDQMHAEHIIMALEAGKHVICTKPLMVSLEDANRLLDVQERTGKIVFVGQSSRYFEPARRQRQDYDNHLHGELLSVETHYITDARWFLERPWSREKGFSWMYNFFIHAVDFAVWYLPDIETVYGRGYVGENTKAYGLNVADTLSFLMTDAKGRTATVRGSYAGPTLGSAIEQSISCTLRGSKGISRAGYPKLKYYTNFEPVEKTAKLQEFNNTHDYYFRFEKENHHAGEYQNYIEEFASLMNAHQVPKPDLKEGIRTLAVMEAMELSMRTKNIVKIQDILDRWDIDLEGKKIKETI